VIAIAVLTWNRLPALKRILEGLKKCNVQKVAVFEDAGMKDQTVGWISQNWPQSESRPELVAYKRSGSQTYPEITCYLGAENLGVAGNSNRAIRWFMEETACDYLCLCNDDLEILGDFPRLYREAHLKTGIGLFSFCGIDNPDYQKYPAVVNGIEIDVIPRLTGSMLAFPRKLVEDIGYFDTRFGKFGEEHCHFNTRAQISGHIRIGDKNYPSVDLRYPPITYQEVQPSASHAERTDFNKVASAGVKSIDYIADGLYAPFRLFPEQICGGCDGLGISESVLNGWKKLQMSSI
jgi:hypothetical protein